MKKFIFSLIVGAIFIGAGIGVLFMEISEFTCSDYLPYITQQKAETFVFEDENIFSDNDGKTVEIDIYLDNYFQENGKCRIIEDSSVEGVVFELKYLGQKPRFRFSQNHYIDPEKVSYNLYAYHETYLPKDLLEASRYMFTEKVFVRYPDNFYVSEVIIRTNHPDLIKTSY